MKKTPVIFIATILLVFIATSAFGQEDADTFFLARKKGILGRIGRSISTDGNVMPPMVTVNPFLRFAGLRISSIEVKSIGLDRKVDDSSSVKKSFIIDVANAFHKNTKEKYIRNNLFFREGDILIPFLLSDNERFLREQEFLQDAFIVVFKNVNDNKKVDILVITHDVFSLGASARMSSLDKFQAEIKEENVAGTGSRLAITGLYDKERSPATSYGAEYLRRNISGNFFNWKVGFSNFLNSYISGRNEEISMYSSIERPLVNRYTEWTGALELAYNQSKNHYRDTLFDSNFNYRYVRTDLWGGYNIGAKRKKLTDNLNRLRHFIAVRTFYTRFNTRPLRYKDTFNYNYADINGVLFGYTLFKQNFYQTNFIYGFGRTEDVPIGLNAAATAGWTNKDGKKRYYYGLSGQASRYTGRGNYFDYNLRIGSFAYDGHFEDIDMLIGIDHFTALRRLNANWRNRNFINVAFTRQHNHVLSAPLFLQSEFGLPYYNNGLIQGNIRSTIRAESVFFNMRRFLGFRFAPFVFGGTSFITPVNESFSQTKPFSAFGGGVRTRNENLVLGTMELKGYLFTKKTHPDMKTWRVEFSTNLKFKYNSSFIKRPDFVHAN